jgi:hypothetical protein
MVPPDGYSRGSITRDQGNSIWILLVGYLFYLDFFMVFVIYVLEMFY